MIWIRTYIIWNKRADIIFIGNCVWVTAIKLFVRLFEINPKTINYNIETLQISRYLISLPSLGPLFEQQTLIFTPKISQISKRSMWINRFWVWFSGFGLILTMNKWSTHVLYMNTSSSPSTKSESEWAIYLDLLWFYFMWCAKKIDGLIIVNEIHECLLCM